MTFTLVVMGCGTSMAEVPSATPAQEATPAPRTVADDVTSTPLIEVQPADSTVELAVPAHNATANGPREEDESALESLIASAKLHDITRITGVGADLLRSAITDAASRFHRGHTFDTNRPRAGESAVLRRFVTVASPVMDSRKQISISQGMRMDSHATPGLEFGHRVDFLEHSAEPFADALNWSQRHNTPKLKKAILKSLRKTIAKYRTR